VKGVAEKYARLERRRQNKGGDKERKKQVEVKGDRIYISLNTQA
jgi:hypothetical protein